MRQTSHHQHHHGNGCAAELMRASLLMGFVAHHGVFFFSHGVSTRERESESGRALHPHSDDQWARSANAHAVQLRVQWVYQLSHSLGSCQLEGIVTCARAAEQMSVGPAAGQAIRHRMFCLPCHMVTPLGLGTSLQSSSNSSFPHTCGAQCLHSHAKPKHAIKLSTSSAYMARPHT